jgi:hypothetical protein
MTADTATALTPAEATDLARLERRIEAGIAIFDSVGRALAEIRDRRLYRATHASFDDYLLERWEFTRQRAAQLIGAAVVAANLSTSGLQPPATERQARPLAGLAAEAQAAAWAKAQEAAGTKQPKASDVERAAPRSLRGLSAEEQLEAIRGDESRVEAEHSGYRQRRAQDADLQRLQSVRHHLKNARRHAEQVTLVDVSRMVGTIRAALAELDEVAEEARELAA